MNFGAFFYEIVLYFTGGRGVPPFRGANVLIDRLYVHRAYVKYEKEDGDCRLFLDNCLACVS